MTAWLTRYRPVDDARLRLLCLPFAGGTDAAYRAWPDALPADVEVCGVCLPGRDARRREPPHARMTTLVPALADGLAAELERPFALFGHSMGAGVAFGLARELRRRGRPAPALLIVSGRRAPQLPEPDPWHALPTDALVARLRRLGGTPDVVLREPELMAMFLPVIRADLAVIEAEPYREEPPLELPIVALGGESDDRCSRAELEAWRAQTTSAFTSTIFPGSHFFVTSAARQVLAQIAAALASA
ncbi:MAG: alpha/beta fold hydrolase [Kofleriaceae bacterium]